MKRAYVVLLACLVGCPKPQPPAPPKVNPVEKGTSKEGGDAVVAALKSLVEFRAKHEESLTHEWLTAINSVRASRYACLTEKRKGEQSGDEARAHRVVESAWPGPGSVPEILESTPMQDGRVSLRVKNLWWHGEPLSRVIFRKVDGAWLLDETYPPCLRCDAKGDSNCPTCHGEKVRRENPASIKSLVDAWIAGPGTEWVFPEPKTEYSTDLSSPSAAALTWADSIAREHVELSLKDMQCMKQALADLRGHVPADRLAECEKRLSERISQARPFHRPTAKVASVDEKAEDASVVLEMTDTARRDLRGSKLALKLKKVGDRWLVDAEP